MKSLHRWLTDLLFADVETAGAASAAITQANQWRALLQLSLKWRVIPQLWQRLQALDVSLKPTVRSEFGRMCRVIAVQSNTSAHRSVQVLQALEKAGIHAVAFKGIGVMAGLYDKPGDRMVGDVDILVEPEALSAAIEAVMPLGFTPVLPGELTDYLDYLNHRTRADNLFLIFKDASDFEIDLHWGLKATAGVQFSVSGILERGVTVTLLNQPVRVASPAHAMLLSVHHSVRDDLAPASAIKDLCDLNAWWHNRDRWDLAEVISQAQTVGLSQPLLALWQVLAASDPAHPANEGVAQLTQSMTASAQANAQKLHSLFTLQLQGEQINRDLVNGLNWTTVKRFMMRRIKQGSTLSFDKALWGISHNKQFNLNKIQRLLTTLASLDRNKLDAYKALSELQDKEP